MNAGFHQFSPKCVCEADTSVLCSNVCAVIRKADFPCDAGDRALGQRHSVEAPREVQQGRVAVAPDAGQDTGHGALHFRVRGRGPRQVGQVAAPGRGAVAQDLHGATLLKLSTSSPTSARRA